MTGNLKIANTTVWVLPNIWRLGWVMDTKFSMNVSNRMSLNAAKFQGYSFCRFWVIKGNPTGGGGGGKTTPPTHTHTQTPNTQRLGLHPEIFRQLQRTAWDSTETIQRISLKPMKEGTHIFYQQNEVFHEKHNFLGEILLRIWKISFLTGIN